MNANPSFTNIAAATSDATAIHATDPEAETTSTTELAPPVPAVALTGHGTLVPTSGLCVYEKTEDGTRHLADVPDSQCLRINDTAVDPPGPRRGRCRPTGW
ncbi:hypothetical protein [Streptomyces sp. NPDC048419]|uniref:hypothetical protein n=1 Tax=Streptomyces sp. NPDC048419 TaxID=3365547 RepID=UPI00371ED6A5